MAALFFDTHKAVKDLQEAGFDESQAEAVVGTVGTAIIGNVATTQDVRDVRQEISDLRSELRSELQAMELRITLRMGGLIVAGVGLIIALDQLL